MSDYSFGDSGLKHGFNKRDEDSISSFFKDLGDKPVRHQVRQPVEPDIPGLEDLNKDVRPAKRIREHTPESDTPDFFDDSEVTSSPQQPEYTGLEEHDDYATSEEELAIHHAGEDIREMPSSSGSSSSQNSSEVQPEEQSEEQDETNDDKQDDSKDEADAEQKDDGASDGQEENGDTQQKDASHEPDEKRGLETAGSNETAQSSETVQTNKGSQSNEAVQSNGTTQSTESPQSDEEKSKESTVDKTAESFFSSNASSIPVNRALVVARATLGDSNGLPQKEVRPALKAENVYVLKNMLVHYGLPADVGWGVFFESIVSALIKLAEGSHDFTSHESVLVDYLKNCTLGHKDPEDSFAALDRIDKGIRSIYFTLNENKRISDQNLLMTGLLLAKYMNIQDEKSDRLNGITFVENGVIEKILEFVSRDQQTREKALKADEIKKSRRP